MVVATREDRPVYRHVVVKRRNLVEKVANPEDFRRLRQQLDAGQPVDDDLKHLVVQDTLKKTMKKVMGWSGHEDVDVEGVDSGGLNPTAAFSEAQSMKDRGDEREAVRYKKQPGVVVSRIVKEHIPGGEEAMPGVPVMLHHPGFDVCEDPEHAFMEAARKLMGIFMEHSDRQFLLMDDDLRSGCTLVTLVLTPIIAIPRATVGVELICEFHQKTRFGFVDTANFDVFSEVGDFPITPPGTMDLTMMMKTADQVLGVVPNG
jgi:hypothetical protein